MRYLLQQRRFCPTSIHLACTEIVSIYQRRVELWEKKKRNLTFFLLVGVRHDGICSGIREAANSKRWTRLGKWSGLLCSSKVFSQRRHSQRSVAVSTWRRRDAELGGNTTVSHWSFIFLACSWMIRECDWCPSARSEWQLKLEGWSCRQCKRAPNLRLAVAVQLCWSLVSVIVERDGNASGKAGTAAGLKWVKSTEHASC